MRQSLQFDVRGEDCKSAKGIFLLSGFQLFFECAMTPVRCCDAQACLQEASSCNQGNFQPACSFGRLLLLWCTAIWKHRILHLRCRLSDCTGQAWNWQVHMV